MRRRTQPLRACNDVGTATVCPVRMMHARHSTILLQKATISTHYNFGGAKKKGRCVATRIAEQPLRRTQIDSDDELLASKAVAAIRVVSPELPAFVLTVSAGRTSFLKWATERLLLFLFSRKQENKCGVLTNHFAEDAHDQLITNERNDSTVCESSVDNGDPFVNTSCCANKFEPLIVEGYLRANRRFVLVSRPEGVEALQSWMKVLL